ncbi:bifunctional L-alanine/L-glutamate racemase [Mucilaginibacter gynuensis]|uniref:Bifunctional L-alanine/L-glutamate racemase n=1 Tax=Mucilaginibacter gynuensis TaxID=1302236 RepID=A0ABP8G9G3_9SPHI
MELSFILNELGEDRENYFNAISPPVMQSSNFAFKTVADFRQAMANEFEAGIYSRGQNPTLNILRKKLAALDGAEDALLFSSGIAAIAVPLISLLKQGDHVVAIKNPYNWVEKLFTNVLGKYGVTATFVNGNDVQNFIDATQPNTRLIYLESPNTLTFELQDITRIAEFAKLKGIITMIDNSYCSPLFQKPISMGIDLVAQSATKYIGGHSDIVAGVLTGSKALMEQLFNNEFMNIGAALSPQTAWLMIRGLRTLPLRIQRSFETAKLVTAYLRTHHAVDKVYWPFNPDHKQAELARRQMKGCGGLFSFTLKNSSEEKIERFCNGLKHILMGVSWGGHESLVMPVLASINNHEYDVANERHQMMRMYVGLEDPEYIIEDLRQALS